MAISFQSGAPIDPETRLRAVIVQQVSPQSQMSGLIAAFWLITANFVVMVPLLMLLKAGNKTKSDAPVVIADWPALAFDRTGNYL